MRPALGELFETEANRAPPGGRVEIVTTADGVRLRTAFWPATQRRRRGTVLIVNGRTEFIEKYFEVIGDLLGRGFAAAAFDWRGQGGSERLVAHGCHVESFADYDRDLDAVMRHVVLPDGPAPLFALAHSMGALIALRATAEGRVRFERMVLTTPMVGLSRLSTPPLWLLRAVIWLRLLLGQDYREAANRALKARDQTAPEPRHIRIDDALNQAPQLKTGRPTTRWVYATLSAIRRARRPAFTSAIRCPTLLVTAGRDRVVANDAVERFAGDVRYAKQVIIPGARHELMLEPDPVREEFWAAFDAFVPGTDPFGG